MVENSSEKHAALLKQVFAINPESIMLLDVRGRVVEVNAQVEKILGYKPEEIIGKFAFSLPFLSKESVKKIKQNFIRRLSGKKISEYDIELWTKNGEKLMGSILGQLVKDDRGLPAGLIIVVRNVTEQRKAVEELKRLQKRTENYLDVTNSMIIVLKSSGEVKLINKTGLKLLGYSRDEIVGKDWFKLVIPKEERSKLKEVFNLSVKGKDSDLVKNENEVITKNGKRLLIRFQSSILIRNNGEIVEVVSSGQDITKEYQATKSLKEVQEMMALVMQHSSEVYYINSVIYDKLDYVSEGCLHMMGYSQEELRKNWTVILSKSPINKQAIIFTKQAIKTGKKQDPYFMEIKTKNGVIKMTEIDETPIKDEKGKVIGVSGVVRDISERFKAETELNKKLEQLENINNVVVGRELKMIELKKRITKLERDLAKEKNEKK